MQALFSNLPTRQFPPQTRKRTRPERTRPERNRHAERYGPSNPSIFTLVMREHVTVAPVKRDVPLYTLEEKDPFGEWRNAFEERHTQTLYHLLRLPNDYEQSATFIRRNRPGNPHEALQFWLAPASRAHLLNALLTREHRTVAQLHRDMNLKLTGSSKLHEYLRRWKITWERPERDTALIDASGTEYQARVTSVDHKAGTAQVRLTEYTLTVPARYDPRGRVYRTPGTLNIQALVPLIVAADLLGLTLPTARTVLPVTTYSAPARVPLVTPELLHATMPEHAWRTTLTDALASHNPCRCAFWNHHAKSCGLDAGRTLPQPGTAAFACDDHEHHA